jgi:predicted amidohydrolase
VIVAGLQFDIAWESPDENFARTAALAEQAVAGEARLLVLPEMFATGFSMNAAAITPYAGRIRDFLRDLARQHGVWVLGGYGEPGEVDGRARNACALFDPQGDEQLRYHKIHPFTLAKENEHYDGGSTLSTVEIEGVRMTPLICYDLRFPEPFRAAADRTDLFCVIANWPTQRREAWRTLLRARAIENQCYVIGVNRVGDAKGHVHSGDSALVDALGETVVEKRDDAALLLGEVDAARVGATRRVFSFLADRRPAVYDSL